MTASRQFIIARAAIIEVDNSAIYLIIFLAFEAINSAIPKYSG